MYIAVYTFTVIVMIAIVIKLVDIHLGPRIQRALINSPERAEAWLAELERQDRKRFLEFTKEVNETIATFTMEDWRTLILEDFTANKVTPPSEDLVHRLAFQKSRVARQVLATRD